MMKSYQLALVHIYILMGFRNVYAIDCYECMSVSGDNRHCEDKFKRNLKTAVFIARNCDFGFFKGTHCIKLKGKRDDGSNITVRQCGDYNWGRHCGDIKYMIDPASETNELIHGCLETCDTDGCNHANTPNNFSVLFSIIQSIVAAMFVRTRYSIV